MKIAQQRQLCTVKKVLLRFGTRHSTRSCCGFNMSLSSYLLQCLNVVSVMYSVVGIKCVTGYSLFFYAKKRNTFTHVVYIANKCIIIIISIIIPACTVHTYLTWSRDLWVLVSLCTGYSQRSCRLILSSSIF